MMTKPKIETRFTKQLGIDYPIICGAMYPCSNPELVAAVSEAGGIGVVQPISLTYVHGYPLKEGLDYVRSLTKKPFGLNVLVEQSSKIYEQRMKDIIDFALEYGCRFFVTALGNPGWVVDKVRPYGGIVYHDVTQRKWAEKALKHGVDGLICVNNRAGGHAGILSPQALYDELKDLGVPLICAGGIGDEKTFIEAMNIGYDGVQMGTRFIATEECREKQSYKDAIIGAHEEDIILTERVTGIPLSVIKTPYVEKMGTKIGFIARFLFRHRRTKPWIRTWYGWRAMRQFKKTALEGGSSRDYWQAGKSVEGIHGVEKAGDVVRKFAEAYLQGH